jgi:predicted phage-related endonuclease
MNEETESSCFLFKTKKGVFKMSTKDLQTKVEELKELKELKEELQAEINSIEEELKAECEKQQTEELKAGIFKIRYKTVESTRFDTNAFKKAHSDLYALFTRQTVSRRFTVA